VLPRTSLVRWWLQVCRCLCQCCAQCWMIDGVETMQRIFTAAATVLCAQPRNTSDHTYLVSDNINDQWPSVFIASDALYDTKRFHAWQRQQEHL
jgi:hypothetical protein